MMLLPCRNTSCKIATFQQAPTRWNVWPISSGRNVMVKVKDTLSFIEAARALHGDRYDYSQTEYTGANQPIKIICKQHGIFTLRWAASHYTKKGSGCQKCSGCQVRVRDTESFIAESKLIHGDQYDYSVAKFSGCKKPVVIKCKIHGEFVLAEAQSHYGKKQCGCKSCTTEKRKSGEIGVPVKTMVCQCGFTGRRSDFKAQSSMCKTCHAKQREEKYTIKCKGCDNRVSTSLKKPYCSHECRRRHKPVIVRSVVASCCVCGKEVARKIYGNQEVFCCSMNCQRKWALIANRGSGGSCDIDWGARSKKAKDKWRKQRQVDRKKHSLAWAWIKKSKNCCGVFIEKNPWLSRSFSASSMLSQRMNPSEKRNSKSRKCDWETASKDGLRRLVGKTKRSLKCGWNQKVVTIAGTLRRRRDLRNAKSCTWKLIEN